MPYSPAPANSLMWITDRPDIVFVRGEGSWLIDQTGKRYLDFMQGWAVNALGHSHPAIIEALTQQAGQLINPSPAFYNEPSLALAKLLTDYSVFDRVFFANSGAEANEGAIKLARKWGQLHRSGAFEIVTFEDGFHGRTLATMSASGKPGWDVKFAPQVQGFPKARLNDLSSVEAMIGRNTVAIMLEPVQGEAGVIPATTEFLRGLRELADRHQLLLIVDEVQTGIGRTGKLFAYEHAEIEPDIMTLGKGLGGGVPLAALLAREACCCFVAGDQGGTFCGNPLATAVGVAVLKEILAPGFLAAVIEKAAYLSARLEDIRSAGDHVEVRGAGLLLALVLVDERASTVVLEALHRQPHGLLLNAPRPNVLRFMPALNVTIEEIDVMVSDLGNMLGT